jgi:RNA polymerase sigma-70 factor (ECF subfamily)
MQAMEHAPVAEETKVEPTDEALAARALAGDRAVFELLMRRNNQRMYRVVRSVLHDRAEIEEAMQAAYVAAFTHLAQFKGTARWSSWLCQIAFNEALARVRQRGRFVSIDAASEGPMAANVASPSLDPERAVGDRELGRVLERAIDRLPDMYRTVLMLRQVEGMDTAQTAAVLDVDEAVVKTRLHRARALLRADIEQSMGVAMDGAFAFGAERCDRLVAAVMALLAG